MPEQKQKKPSRMRRLRQEQLLLPFREYLLKVVLPTGVFRAIAFPALLYLFGQRNIPLLMLGALTFTSLMTLFDIASYKWARKKLASGDTRVSHPQP